MPTKQKIAEWWASTDPDWISIEYSHCFACGREPFEPTTWNGTRFLQRAHIVAGGPPLQSNFLLLCPRCHRQAPTLNLREPMICWAKHQEAEINYFWRRLNEELERVGIDIKTIQVPRGIDHRATILAFAKLRGLGLHPHASEPPFSGAAAIIKDYLLWPELWVTTL